jgi:ligand-binding sensor domain-containing protein
MKRNIFFLLIIFLGIEINLVAQQNVFISFRNYSQQEGLSSYNITKIIKDRYGFLWVGTQDGINCFDGNDFLVFNKESEVKHALSGNNITELIEDRSRNLIWAATSLGGVVAIDTRTQTVSRTISANTIDPHRKGLWIHSLGLCGDLLWIGTYGGLFAYHIRTGQFQIPDSTVFKETNFHSLNVTRILCDHLGRIWAFCDGLGILVLSGQTGKLISKIPVEQLNFFGVASALRFWNVFESDSNEIYMATSWGLRKIENAGSNSGVSLPEDSDFFYNDELFACAKDVDDRIWFSNANSLFRWDTKQKKVDKILDINQEADTRLSTIYSLYSDDQGYIWAGSEEGLSILHRDRQQFDKYYHSFYSSTKIQHAFSLHMTSDSIIYCGSADGLYKVNLNSRSIMEMDGGHSCYMIDEIHDKQLIISNSRGLFVLTKDQMIPANRVYPCLEPLQHELLCASVHYNDSIIVFGSQIQNGLYVWNTNKGTITSYNSKNSHIAPDNDVVNALFKDKSGRLWVLSINTIFLFDPLTGSSQSFQITDPASKLKCGILFDMCETANSFWIAGYGMGLIETDKLLRFKQLISTKEGLCNNGVYKVFPFRDSLVLITSNNGLSALRIADNHIKNYYATDGLQSNAFEQFCGTRFGEQIYAGGVKGFTQINPAYFTINKISPPLYISRIRINTTSDSQDTTNMSFSEFTIPNDAIQTAVYFSNLDYSAQGNGFIDYKIREINNDWIHLNGQRFVNLIGMNPGVYTLMVRSVNSDNVWSETKEIKLIFLPKWYQTLWFKLLVISVIAGLIYSIFRYRINQIKQQQQIRKNIASDLHDDIGSTLNSVKIFAHLAKREGNKGNYLNNIEESLMQASLGLRDLIWVLDDSFDTVYELMERIKKYALPVCHANNIQFESSVESDANSKLISKSEKRNLLLLSKETINNSLKYAQCTIIKVKLRQVNRKIELLISDNGKGFDTNYFGEGNGLKNIRRRADQIHYRVQIISSPGKGTQVELKKT